MSQRKIIQLLIYSVSVRMLRNRYLNFLLLALCTRVVPHLFISKMKMRSYIFIIILATTKSVSAQSCPDNNHPHAIDLGLPSGTRWSCCNVGAETPEQSGGFYAWGETVEKSNYDKYSYIFYNATADSCQYLGNIVGSQYDVSHTMWGSTWQLPNNEQCEELCKKCFVSYKQINEENYVLITGPNKNSILVPEKGIMIGTELQYPSSASLWMASDNGMSGIFRYMSAGVLAFSYESMWITGSDRYKGCNVRPVQNGISTYKTGRQIIQENGFKPSVAPLLNTEWTQWGAENSLLPLYDLNERVAAGCGPVALAQILKYWEYPSHGVGSNYYLWNNNFVLSADYNNSYYNWDDMISRYENNKNVTSKQSEAVARLIYDIEVALETKLSYSTATQIEYIHSALKAIFGYNPNMQLLRQINHVYSMEEWLKIMYNELSNGRPILLGGTTNGGANHIFVADGYDEDGKIHYNLGHANRGNENVYYDITENGITYTQNLRMIIGICPNELPASITSVTVNTAGTLLDVLGGLSQAQKLTRLKISGNLNKTDIELLRQLTMTTTGQLSYIDLYDCTLDNDRLPTKAFYGGGEQNYVLQYIKLPKTLKEIGSYSFRGCKGLYKVEIPSSLKSIEQHAFADCRYLRNITIPKDVISIGDKAFLNDKLDQINIEAGNTYCSIKNGALLTNNGTLLNFCQLKPEGNYIIPDGVKSIGSNAFTDGLRIKSISFPGSVERISSNAFLGTMMFTDLFFHSVTAPTAPNSDNIMHCIIHVPHGLKDEYASKGWDKYAAIVDDCELDAFSTIGAVSKDEYLDDEYYTIQGMKANPFSQGVLISKKKRAILIR